MYRACTVLVCVWERERVNRRRVSNLNLNECIFYTRHDRDIASQFASDNRTEHIEHRTADRINCKKSSLIERFSQAQLRLNQAQARVASCVCPVMSNPNPN